MLRSSFTKFLEKRNLDFIDSYSSESALGMIYTLRNTKSSKEDKRNCVLISFDPPLNSPPIVFDWKEQDVWYLKSPTINQDFFNQMDDRIEQSLYPYIIFLERDSLSHKRKIARFIKNYREQMFRNRPLDLMPKFILAEYKNVLSKIKLTELVGGPHDSLLS
jgi:hypothetical protein